MTEVQAQLADGRRVHIVFTDRSDGHFHHDVDSRPSDNVPHPLTWMHQVHGSHVVVVEAPGRPTGVEADAAVVAVSGAAIAVRTADCAPIAVVANGGAVAVIHAGWRGLLAGVVQEAVAELTRHAEGPYQAVLGPCIHPECYEFSEADLGLLVDRFGPAVRGVTAGGAPALDLPAAVTAAVSELGIALETSKTTCTACSDTFYSHRARGDRERQALVAWIDDPERGPSR